MDVETIVQTGYQRALKAFQGAYCPYSKFSVGACFYGKEENTFYTGFNIENASYPASLCAERVALSQMFAQTGKAVIPTFLVVVTDTEYALGPCGQCLQVLTEFCPPEMNIYLGNLNGIVKQTRLDGLIQFDAVKFKKTLQR